MLKSLFPRVDWAAVRAVGFDMDGTLYPEEEFIAQVYRPVARHLAGVTGSGEGEIYEAMLARWREKGSSYSRIFEEVLRARGIEDTAGPAGQCVEIFRSFKPRLELPERSRRVLEECAARYPLFLITDGSARLQAAKFAALGLGRWFAKENVAISGTHGRDFQKPALGLLSHIALFKEPPPAGAVVYFGDRECDRLFAENAGFLFVAVQAMNPV